MTEPKLLSSTPVERACGGTVEMFHVEQDTALPYRLRITLGNGKQYAVMMRDKPVMEAVAKNWARGETQPPWAHLVDGDWGMK